MQDLSQPEAKCCADTVTSVRDKLMLAELLGCPSAAELLVGHSQPALSCLDRAAVRTSFRAPKGTR